MSAEAVVAEGGWLWNCGPCKLSESVPNQASAVRLAHRHNIRNHSDCGPMPVGLIVTSG
jgi:hypothetical protein